MKTIIKNGSTLLIAIVGTAMLMWGTGCKKDIFDKKDLNAADSTIWNTASSANTYVNAIYDLVMPNWPTPGSNYNTSDELNNAPASPSVLYGTLTGTANEITYIFTSVGEKTDIYFPIYHCNLALQSIDNGLMAPADKAIIKGQVYFLRAYTYFSLVKLYGGVPLILHPQNPQVENVQTPRAKTSDCIKQITADLDSAAKMLPASWTQSTDGGRITRAAAMAMKGKVLLYWASPQFNPTNIAQRWSDAYAANKAAYAQAVTDGFVLEANFANIWTDETNNKERMIWRTLDATSVSPAHGTNIEAIDRPVSETVGGGGSNQPTWNLVQAFPMANGLPITDPASGYNAEFFWQNRDPRFAATVAYNGCVWNLSGKTNRLQWTYQSFLDDATKPSATGFYCRKFSINSLLPAATTQSTNTGGGNGMDWIEFRLAELILNYAESSFYAPEGNIEECKTFIAKLRARAGISSANNYGLAGVTAAQMPAILLTEREVEFAMENKRNDDLRRTRQFDKLTGTARQAYRWTLNSPYVAGNIPTGGAVAGKVYIDLPDANGKRIIDTLDVNKKAVYEKFFSTSIVTIEPSANPVINFPVNQYFYPLPPNFISTSSAIQQTAGWPGGTFDPLQ